MHLAPRAKKCPAKHNRYLRENKNAASSSFVKELEDTGDYLVFLSEP